MGQGSAYLQSVFLGSESSCKFFSERQGASCTSLLALDRLLSSARTKSPASFAMTSQRADSRPFGATTCFPALGGHTTQSLAGRSGQRRTVVGSGRRLRYGKLFLRSLAPSPPPLFSAAAVGGEHREVRVAAAAASPGPDRRAAGQVLSAPGASLAASLLCPAVRLPQCTWGVGGRWAPGSGGGGGCGAGQKQPPIQAAGGPRAPGALRAPGSAMGTFTSSSTAPAS